MINNTGMLNLSNISSTGIDDCYTVVSAGIVDSWVGISLFGIVSEAVEVSHE